MVAPAPRILVVEDQLPEREALSRLLRTKGFKVVSAKNVTEATAISQQSIDLVISDLRLGTESGIDLLQHWSKHHPEVPFIVVTAFGEVESAVNAMKLGAVDYLTKPLHPEELLHLVERYTPSGLERTSSVEQNSEDFSEIIGHSAAMQDVFDRVRRVAASESLVLITGESGTGKELIADSIHRLSSRRDGPYVPINIAAIPDSLVEGELFGYVKGAFTGASQDRKGRFEASDGGTLFIDEVGDFPLALQPKLLRVLEGFLVCPVGSNHERPVNVRVIAATSRNLHELVTAGAFREDLFYRLNVLTIHLPPLRERRADIPILIQRFLQESARRHLRDAPNIASDLATFLESYDWPGNVRQLRNAIENMVVMARSKVLTLNDLPRYLSDALPSNAKSDSYLQELERNAILTALEQFQGNRTRAAEHLGISVRTLQRKLKQWGASSDANIESLSETDD